MSSIIDAVICTPFGAILKYIYLFTRSYGVSIILFTILAKIILVPIFIKSKSSMYDMQKLTPKLKELQKKYENDKNKYNEEAAKLYQEAGVSPMGGCAPMILIFVIMIGLYYVICRPLSFFFGMSADEITALANALNFTIPESAAQFRLMEIQLANEAMQNFSAVSSISDKLFHVNFSFLGIPLADTPQWGQFNTLLFIPFISAITAMGSNIVTTKMQKKLTPSSAVSGSQTVILMGTMVLMSLWFGFAFPAGIGIYWITSNIFAAAQEVFITNHLMKKREKEEKQAQLEREAIAAARKEIEAERIKQNQDNQKKKKGK